MELSKKKISKIMKQKNQSRKKRIRNAHARGIKLKCNHSGSKRIIPHCLTCEIPIAPSRAAPLRNLQVPAAASRHQKQETKDVHMFGMADFM